jgi:hypothetical protein
MSCEPALLETPRKESEEDETKILPTGCDSRLSKNGIWFIVHMNAPHHCCGLLYIFRDFLVLLTRKNKCKLAGFRKHFADILVTVVLADSIERMMNFAKTIFLQSILNTSHDGFISLSVIDDGVTLASINELLNERLGSSGNNDQGVDVRGLSELDGEGSLMYCKTLES